ncbi:MAG: hypothetical protein HKN36_12905 [Hellea sp.]|nr:hypothetical protein [Hellea sp.]
MKQLVMVAGPYGVGKIYHMRQSPGFQVARGTLLDPQEIHDGLLDYYEEEQIIEGPSPGFLNRTEEKTFSSRFRLVRKGRDLTVVCSLGRIEDLDLIDAAKSNGYHISLYYYGLKDWKLCRKKIRSDKYHWLHQEKDEFIYDHYFRSSAMLPGAIRMVDHGRIFDVSRKDVPTPLLDIDHGRVNLIEKKPPNWIVEPLTRCL